MPRNKWQRSPVSSAEPDIFPAHSSNIEDTVMRLKNNSGAAIAAAAAVLFSTGMVKFAVAADEAKIHCSGVNSCKGQSACKSANNSCKGQNSCKGKGFLEMTPTECKDAQDHARSLLQGKQ
jgi:hypothetical protein